MATAMGYGWVGVKSPQLRRLYLKEAVTLGSEHLSKALLLSELQAFFTTLFLDPGPLLFEPENYIGSTPVGFFLGMECFIEGGGGFTRTQPCTIFASRMLRNQ